MIKPHQRPDKGPGELEIWIPGTRIINRHAIRQARKFRGMTMQMLADKLGIEHTTISRWESGATVPRGIYLRGIVVYLHETNRIIRTMVAELRKEMEDNP